jgi:hypothetical protein
MTSPAKTDVEEMIVSGCAKASLHAISFAKYKQLRRAVVLV